MPKFALRYPFFIIMLCLMVMLVGVVNTVRMPVDLFPKIDMPVVVVATFYSGMPPEQIEADITNTFERFFTLAASVDHSESRSLTGVSLIKIYFKPGHRPNAALSNIANLAMADLRRLPPGTLPPVVLGMDASTQPVCLVTLKGEGLNETAPQRSCAVSGAQPDLECARRVGTATLWRHLPPDSDLRRSAEARSAQPEPERCGEGGEQLKPDFARRRCAHRTKDYNIYANSQFPIARVNERDAAEIGGQLRRCWLRTSATPRTRARCSTTLSASMGSARCTCPCSNRVAAATQSPLWTG